jgi:hypothetical protein
VSPEDVLRAAAGLSRPSGGDVSTGDLKTPKAGEGSPGAAPAAVGELLERRLAELRPLHEQYRHLLAYAELIHPSPSRPAAKPAGRERARPGVLRREILAELADGPRTLRELRERTGAPETRLGYNVRRLLRMNVIAVSQGEGETTYTLQHADQESESPKTPARRRART